MDELREKMKQHVNERKIRMKMIIEDEDNFERGRHKIASLFAVKIVLGSYEHFWLHSRRWRKILSKSLVLITHSFYLLEIF